ncbi:MAG: 3-hydroxymyristoyl/3-hydroxydecanoyl-(acyl carrier protein) dehydratase, partial [Bradymonadia bacterium]
CFVLADPDAIANDDAVCHVATVGPALAALVPALSNAASIEIGTGPSLRVSAHAPKVQAPPLPAASVHSVPPATQRAPMSQPTPHASPVQTMAPAPSLPSAMGAASRPAPAAMAPAAAPAVASQSAPAFAPSPVATPAYAAPASPVFGGVQGAIEAQLNELAVLQQAHMAQQSQLHAMYLATQTQAVHTLLGAQSPVAQPVPMFADDPSQPVGLAASQPVGLAASPPAAVSTPLSSPLPVAAAFVTPAASALPAAAAPSPAISPAAITPSVNALADTPAATSVVTTTSLTPADQLPGLKFSREQLEIHSNGKISEIYGPEFAPQDGYERQVRMPLGPLLLCDRVVGLDAEPLSMKKGSIWTETDVSWDAWYLNHDRMPAGIMIESGQADLMLISYLGVDMFNKSDRVYRLLGCELTYHGDLPRAGETLRYDIHLDGHAKHGDVRLMFFHYDCVVGDRPQLSVRGGQAGFFTDKELDDSAGCLWTPEEQDIVEDPQLDAPVVDYVATELNDDQVKLLAAGDVAGAMGDAYGFARAHVRTPSIQSGDMQLFDRVTEIDPTGGPWGRGYLRAEMSLSADRWFYDGHFQNDPCMPGTLMFEGCLQTMATYLIAMGFTLKCDGWRFQPKPEMPFQLSCRGQAIPSRELLTYEVFVEEVVAGPVPTLYADLLCTIDGLKAFHARRVALELVPDWPLESRQDLVESIVDPVPVSEADGFKFGYASMLACAWGKPSDAFGPMYERFDSPMRVARLPGPPYHFMTRVTALEGPIGVMKPGAKVSIEYDIPPDAWYYDQNGCASMPFAVLLEAALQPCGWLASYVGSALTVDSELGFRNLDGTGTLHAELPPNAGTLITHVEMTNVSATGGMIIESFTVECKAGDTLIYSLDTVFGFFPPAALANQAGLPVSDAQREMQSRDSDFNVDLTTQPALYWNPARPLLAEPMLLMIDRVTGYWPGTGDAGIAQLRAEKAVDQAEWFFKAHFFQDPVQPGSLGIEALIQLLQFYMLEAGMDSGFTNPRFEPLGLDIAMGWKYRGQVLLHNSMIESTVDVTEIGTDDRGAFAIANASLWVDGKRIYETTKLGMRIVEADDIRPNPRDPNKPKLNPNSLGFTGRTNVAPSALTPTSMGRVNLVKGVTSQDADWEITQSAPAVSAPAAAQAVTAASQKPPVESASDRRNERQSGRPIHTTTVSTVATPAGREDESTSEGVTLCSLDPAKDRWVADHCPTYTRPALPMMHVVDLLSQAAGLRFHGLRDVRVHGWIVVSEEVSFDAERDGDAVRLYATTAGARREVATAKVIRTRGERPNALTSVVGAAETLPYDSGALFHGPSFQLLDMLVVGDDGASSAIRAASEIPFGRLNPALLDAATHGIPHDNLHRWFEEIGEDKVAYPAVVSELRVYGPTPTKGTVRCEVRTAGTLGSSDYPMFRIQLIVGNDVWCEIRLVESVFPKGPLGSASPTPRQRFLRDLSFEPDVRLSRVLESEGGPTSVLEDADVAGSNWFPGTIDALYGTEDTASIAEQEHLAAAHGVHPRWMPAALPLTRSSLRTERDGTTVTVSGDPNGTLDITPVKEFWTKWFDRAPWPVEDLYYGLIERFVDRVVLEQPEAFATLKGRSVLYVANHETGVESLMFSMIASALNGVPTVTLAKAEHRHTWLGRLIQHCFSYPGVPDPNVMTFFEREDKASLMKIIGGLATEMATTGRSVMIHVEGTRALDATHRVQKMSGAFIDMALKVGAPIVPVRFTGGLPVDPVEKRLEFPLGLAKQSIWFGAPLMPEELTKHHYGARKQLVVNAINNLGGGRVMPATGGDPALVAAAAAWQADHAVDNEHAVLRTVLAERAGITEDTARVLAAKRSWTLDDGTPEGVWLAELGKRLAGV